MSPYGDARFDHDRTTGLASPIAGLTVPIAHDLALEIVYMLDELDARQALDDSTYAPDGVEECGTCNAQLALIGRINAAVRQHQHTEREGR